MRICYCNNITYFKHGSIRAVVDIFTIDGNNIAYYKIFIFSGNFYLVYSVTANLNYFCKHSVDGGIAIRIRGQIMADFDCAKYNRTQTGLK